MTNGEAFKRVFKMSIEEFLTKYSLSNVNEWTNEKVNSVAAYNLEYPDIRYFRD